MDNQILHFILAGVAGVLFHCLLKLNSLLKDARVANIAFNSWKDYWLKDAVSILMSFLSVGIWLLIFGEIAAKYPSLESFAITSFVVMGAIGSYLIQLGLSRAKRQVRQVIDQKTNDLEGTDTKTQLPKN